MIVTPLVGIAGEQRAMDRRRASPARQQRGVDVQAPATRYREHRRRQDQPVGHHDHQFGRVAGQGRHRRGILQRGRLLDGQAERERALLDRARRELEAAACRSVRLGIDSRDLVTGRVQRRQGRHREVGGAGEDQAQGVQFR